MFNQLAPFEIASRLGLAIAMAVFMGLAFEDVYKRTEHTSPGGIRTFPMLTALGAMLYLLAPQSLWPYVVGLAGVALWLFAHIRGRTAEDRGSLMIPTANLLAYTFAPAALSQPPWVVVATAVIAVLLLESREALHKLVQRVPPYEVFTLGKFLILVGIVLPLVPDHPVVSWTAITPFKIWLALVAISTLSYASYLIQRYVPTRGGALLPAILGGIYSSTATTVTLARRQKEAGEARPDLVIGMVVASAMMYLRIDVIVALFNAPLAWLLLPALASLCLLAAIVATWQWAHRQRSAPASTETLSSINPLQLGTAVSFAVLFVVVIVITGWVRTRFGESGVYALAGITGTTDINPFVLNLAQGGVPGMSLRGLAAAVLIAVGSNNVLNGCYALAFGGVKACLRPACVLFALGMIAALSAGLYLR